MDQGHDSRRPEETEAEPLLKKLLARDPSPAPEEPEDGPEEQGEGQEQTGAEARKAASPGRELYMNVRFLATLMAALILAFTFVARIVVVSGPSMENTLHGGDVILVWALGYTPRQNDIVVVTQKTFQEDSIIKRVIATGGQTVDIDYDTGTVYVDGEALEEDYIKDRMLLPGYGDHNNHVTVPEGCIYVMGDNRNQSADSRYPDIGIIDERCVIGRSMFVLFPLDRVKGL